MVRRDIKEDEKGLLTETMALGGVRKDCWAPWRLSRGDGQEVNVGKSEWRRAFLSVRAQGPPERQDQQISLQELVY